MQAALDQCYNICVQKQNYTVYIYSIIEFAFTFSFFIHSG